MLLIDSVDAVFGVGDADAFVNVIFVDDVMQMLLLLL